MSDVSHVLYPFPPSGTDVKLTANARAMATIGKGKKFVLLNTSSTATGFFTKNVFSVVYS